jgi:hypothetical protein
MRTVQHLAREIARLRWAANITRAHGNSAKLRMIAALQNPTGTRPRKLLLIILTAWLIFRAYSYETS